MLEICCRLPGIFRNGITFPFNEIVEAVSFKLGIENFFDFELFFQVYNDRWWQWW